MNIDGQIREGKIYNYNVLFQLYNQNSAKGKRGMSYPKGDVSFDLKMNLERTDSSTNETEDISDLTKLLLYNYSLTGENYDYAYSDRTELNFYTGIYQFPSGNRYKISNPTSEQISRNIYKSGNIQMEQEGNIIHVTIKNYGFDGNFANMSWDNTVDTVNFPDNVGNISKVCFQTFIMDNDETNWSNAKYYFKVSDENMNVTSSSEEKITTQEVENDDTASVQYIASYGGNYWADYYFQNSNGTNLATAWNRGDGAAYIGQNVYGVITFYQDQNNRSRSNTIRSINALYKFDNTAFKPITLNGNNYVVSGDFCKVNFYYAAKPDGTGWKSIDEQNKAKYEDLVYYSSLEDLEADGKTCVGALFETYDCNWYYPDTNARALSFKVPLEVIDTAKYGKTYEECGQIQMFQKELDRSKESQLVENGKYTSKPVYQKVSDTYIKTEYSNDGSQIPGTHVDEKTGNSLLIVGAKSVITNEVVNKNSDGTTKTSYDMGRSEYDVTYKISPSLNKIVANQSTIKATVKVTDVLPAGLSYVANSCSYGEPEVTINSDGSTSLVWYIYDVEVGSSIEPFTFTAHINEESSNDTKYTTIATIYAGDVDKSNESKRKSSNTISTINLASHRLYKSDITPVIEKGGVIHFVVSYKNNTDGEVSNFQLLDILPYNGDGRGTSFNGTYKLEKVVITQQDNSGNTIENNSLKLYYSDDDSSRNANSKDADLAKNWTEITTENVSHSAKAVALIEKVNLDVYLKTDDNKGLDKYVNDASAKVYENTEEMKTSKVTSQVISRTIEGLAWFDKNNNGIKDEDEELAKNVTLSLTDQTGAQVIDAEGKVVSSVKTDENGYYKFTDLPKGNYLVKVSLPDSTYTLTEKEVGDNATINSKFNVDTKTTDIITKLNSVDLPVLTVSNVNIGFVKKDTKVIVNYKEESTGKLLADEEIIEGKADDEYTTQNKLDEINNKNNNEYEFVRVDGQTSGKMTGDTIYITYYYQKKKSNVKVLHVEEGTDISDLENINDVLIDTETITGRIGEQYTTSEKTDEINKKYKEQFQFVKVIGNPTGTITKDTVYVIYEYKKISSKVIVKHLEKDTNIKLYDEEILEGIVGKDYATSDKLNEINKLNGEKYEISLPEPENKNGTYTKDEQVVTYYYQKKNGIVEVNYIDIDTNKQLYDKISLSGKIDDSYTTEDELEQINKANDNKYVLVKVDGNTTGKYEIDKQTVTYYYQKKEGIIEVNYIDIDTNKSLYNQIISSGKIDGKYYTEDKIEQINKENNNNYQLVKIDGNIEGTYKVDKQIITYYYKKINKGTIIVNFIDKEGNILLPKLVSEDIVGNDYYLKAPEIDGYKVVENPEINSTYINGKLTFNIVYEKEKEIITVPDHKNEPTPQESENTEIKEESKSIDTGDINILLFTTISILSASGLLIIYTKKR